MTLIQLKNVLRMSQVTISEGSNSVSSNNSVAPPLVSRGGRFTGRYHISCNGDGRSVLPGKTIFRQQYNNRQVNFNVFCF